MPLAPFVSLHVPPFVLAETLGRGGAYRFVFSGVCSRRVQPQKRSIVETLRLVD